MRYSEANLNRLQIKGELHVKSGKILDLNEVPELDEPLSPGLLVDEASWEIRGQQSRASAVDTIEAVLLDVHYARYLQQHPHVKVRASILQDQLLVDAEHTIKTHKGNKALDKLRKDARKLNLAMSNGRIKSDFVEPEILFWSAWRALGKKARAAIANEALAGFVERVHAAASCDPRGTRGDPMDPHRHRVHPLLWTALAYDRGGLDDAVAYELARFERNPDAVLAKRPVFSQLGDKPPWPDE